MPKDQATYNIVLTIFIALIVALICLTFFKMFSIENRLKDYIYQNEDIRQSLTSQLDGISNKLSEITSKQITIK